MTEQETALDFEAMRQAIEGLDAETLIGFYADDVEVRIVSKNTPPSMPCRFRGRESIAGHLRDVCGRAMTHIVHNEVIGDGRVSFNESCEYPDGMRVLSAVTLDVRDGRIVRQTSVEAWDE